MNDKLPNHVYSSGFPLQIAIENKINETKEKLGRTVQSREYGVGMKPNTETIASLRRGTGGMPVNEIGDLSSIGLVANATEFAYRAAMEIV